MSTNNLTLLLKKREQLEQQILEAERAEKRKNQIVALPEFAKILHLPDEVLREAFNQIAAQQYSQCATQI